MTKNGLRTMVIFTVIALLVGLVSACGKGSGNEAQSSAGSSSPTASSSSPANGTSDEPVTLKMITWENPTTLAAFEKLNEKFSAKYPNVKIVVDHVPTEQYFATFLNFRVTANDADIVTLQGLSNVVSDYMKGGQPQVWNNFVDNGLIMDLSGQPFLNNYYPSAIKNASTYKDKVWTVNTGIVFTTGVFYNKDLFEQNGLKVPTTFQELMDISKTLTDKGISPFTMAGKDVWPLLGPFQGLLNSLIKDETAFHDGLWKGTAKFTDPEYVEALKRMQQIMNYTEKNFQGIDYATVVSRFVSGKTAMLPDGIWQAESIKQANPSLKFGYFPLPGGDSADNTFAGKYDLSLAVANNSKNKDWALKYLEFFSEPENYKEYINAVGFLPTQPNVELQSAFLNEVAPYAETMRLAYDQISVIPANAGDFVTDEAPDRLKPMGNESPESLAEKKQKDWDAAIKK